MIEFLEIFDRTFTSLIAVAILAVLGISGLLLVLEATGLLPGPTSRWVTRNRLHETMRLLREFGVDVDTPRRAISVAKFENVSGKDLAERVERRLRIATRHGRVNIGSEVSEVSDRYIDLMGATTAPDTAKVLARDLLAKWRELAGPGGLVRETNIDFIVTPKIGSPLLGAAYAELLGKPLLLHNPSAKFRATEPDARALFDYHELPAAGALGLLIDDSSTGGGKAIRLITDLRHCGWRVSDFLVVFEPQLKAGTGQNAAKRLQPSNVALHSILKT